MISSATNGSTSLTTITKVFEGRSLTAICYKGTPWWITREIGAVMEYGDQGGRLVDLVLNEWAPDFDNKDRWLVQGEDLKAIKTIINEQLGRGTSRVPSLLLLSESGIWKAALLSRKPEGRRLRDWLSGEVLPEIRRTGSYQGALSGQAEETDRLKSEVIRLQAQLIERLRSRRMPQITVEDLEQQLLGCLQPHPDGLIAELAARLLGQSIPLVKAVLHRMDVLGHVGLRPGLGKTPLYIHPAHLSTSLQKPPEPLDRAAVLLQHIEAGQLREPFTVRAVYIRGWQGLNKAGTEQAVAELVQRDLLVPRPSRGKGAKGGRPTMAYHRPDFDDPANHLMRRIEAGEVKEPFTVRDIYIKHWQGLDKDGVEAAIAVLVEKGDLQPQAGQGLRGRRTVQYARPGGEPKDVAPGVVIIHGRVYAKPPAQRDVRAEILALLGQEPYRGGLQRESVTKLIHRRPNAVLKELRSLKADGKLHTRQEGMAIIYFIPTLATNAAGSTSH